MKIQHWSCSKFADWLRGTSKPSSATLEEWHTWQVMAEKKKLRYWLAEEGLDHLRNIFFWPIDRLHDVRRYINNRWFYRSHAMTSNLKRGQWYDYDMRLLHAVFDELVNFVEIELAWQEVISSEEGCKKYKAPWYRSMLRFGSWRCPAAGIAYLKWASELKKDEEWTNKDAPDFGQPTYQALAAREIISLYTWWKYERPQRSDPHEASGWSEYCEEKHKMADPLDDIFAAKDKEHVRRLLETCHQMEEEQENEDTDMLIRTVKIRKSLWT